MKIKDESKIPGGIARSKSLTAEKRSDIATKAANYKWDHPRALYGSADKTLSIGECELECYVLEDGRRVLSGQGMQEALGLGKSSGSILKEFITQDTLIPFIPSDFSEALNNPEKFIRPGRGGALAKCFEAHLLPDICDAILEARHKGVLTTDRQLRVALQCEIIVRALSRVGIDALIDEITGYQEVRERYALQKILDKYITDDWSQWSITFPESFYKELFRLKGLEYPRLGGRKPQCVGHWTNDIIYDRLAPGVKDELKRINPRSPITGGRKRKHFQYLTEDFGQRELKEMISNTTFLMKGCASWRKFHKLLDMAKPKQGNNLELTLD